MPLDSSEATSRRWSRRRAPRTRGAAGRYRTDGGLSRVVRFEVHDRGDAAGGGRPEIEGGDFLDHGRPWQLISAHLAVSPVPARESTRVELLPGLRNALGSDMLRVRQRLTCRVSVLQQVRYSGQ